MTMLGPSITQYHTVDLGTERKLQARTWTSAIEELGNDERLVVVFEYTGKKSSLIRSTQRKFFTKSTALGLTTPPSVKDHKIVEFRAAKSQEVAETSEEVRRFAADLVGQAHSVQVNNIQASLLRKWRR